MPVTFDVLPDRGVVFVRYEGRATTAEGLDSFNRYAASADFRPGHKHLIDLSQVTHLRTDYVELLKLEAARAFALLGHGVQTLVAYYAPTRDTLELAHLSQSCWEGIDSVVPRVFTIEQAALDFLGLREPRIADLMARA